LPPASFYRVVNTVPLHRIEKALSLASRRRATNIYFTDVSEGNLCDRPPARCVDPQA
jgi:hypothetical protein